jgi:hypothetical protein
MLEVCMSVWPKTLSSAPSLSGREGDLISVSISVDPRYLEPLLEALAQVGFPVNPQIYHDAAMVYLRALDHCGFDPASLQITSMLDQIQSDCQPELAPTGANYVARYRVKHQSRDR